MEDSSFQIEVLDDSLHLRHKVNASDSDLRKMQDVKLAQSRITKNSFDGR